MAVIGIFTEPTGRTRVLFDFSAPTGDEEARIADAMARSRREIGEDEQIGELVGTNTSVGRAKRVVPAFR